MSDTIFKLKVSFDGKNAQNHELPLDDFGKSLQGIASVIAINGTFALTKKIPLKPSEYKVQVSTKAELQAGSVELTLYVKTIADFLVEVGEIGAGVLVLKELLKMIFGRRDKKQDTSTLEKLLQENHETIKLVLEKILAANQKYVELAIQAVGRSCSTMSLTENCNNIATVDKETKKSIQQWTPKQDCELFVKEIVITSLNKRSHKCKFYLYEDYLDDPDEISFYSGKITDETFLHPRSAYIDSLDEEIPIKVRLVKKDTQGLKASFDILAVVYD